MIPKNIQDGPKSEAAMSDCSHLLKMWPVIYSGLVFLAHPGYYLRGEIFEKSFNSL